MKDFRNFLWVVWQHWGLPEPNPLQYDLAHRLQYGPQFDIMQAFRGASKSWITIAYAAFCLYRDPETKIEVVSASGKLADNFSYGLWSLINSLDMLQPLKPKKGQRHSLAQFDVGPSRSTKDPSVKSAGITGQITGTRADLVIADDVEVPSNSMTQDAREKLATAVSEFTAILKPEGLRQIKFLGTPQCEESIYDLLETRGFSKRIWPAEVPPKHLLDRWGEKLAPSIYDNWTPDRVGNPVNPERFNSDVLLEAKAHYGKSGYALQFMLDTSMSDSERHPLKLQDLIVMDVDSEQAPDKIVWAAEPDRKYGPELPCVGLQGDRFYRPLQIVGEWEKYSGKVLFIDPSGRGKDETGYAVVGMRNSFLYAMDVGGLAGGYSSEVLTFLAKTAREYQVNSIQIESNFGDGMYSQLLKPVLQDIYPCYVEEIRHSGQKEARIIDTLEPVMNRHRLVMDAGAIRRDHKSTEQYGDEAAKQYMMTHQMTRITRDKGSLRHDDRLEALAGAVAYWTINMSINEDAQMKKREEEKFQEELDRFMKDCDKTWGTGSTGPNWITN